MSIVPNTSAAIAALGNAWRMNWSDFDGRTLRGQLEGIDALMLAEIADPANGPEGLRRFLVGHGICPTCRMWVGDCDGHAQVTP